MLKIITYKSSITTLLGFVLAILFALVLAPAANAESSFDATNSKLSSERKEQIKKYLQDAQTRISELREKNKVPVINGLNNEKKLELEDLHNKSRAQLEEVRKKAEVRIKELREESRMRTDNVKKYSSKNADQSNAIGESVKQMSSGERSALFGEIIKRLQKIDTERGDSNPMLKAAIEQLEKLRSQP